MRTTDMNMHPIDGSTFMTIVTIGFYVLCKIPFPAIGAVTWQGLAGIMAVLAGSSTLLLNLYRFYKEYTDRNKKT